MRLEIKYNKGDSRQKQVKEQTQSRKKKKRRRENLIKYYMQICHVKLDIEFKNQPSTY